EQRVKHARLDVRRKDGVKHGFRVWFKLVQRSDLTSRFGYSLNNFEGEEAIHLRYLAHHTDQSVVDEVNFLHSAFCVFAIKAFEQFITDLFRGRELWVVGTTDPHTLGGAFAEGEVSLCFTSDEVVDDLFSVLFETLTQLFCFTQHL